MGESSGCALLQGVKQKITQNVRRALTTNEILEYIDDPKSYVTTRPPDPNEPPANGSIILYDTNAVKVYREDGHKWTQERHCPRKKKGVVVLHTYVADGSANVNFERRIYRKMNNAPNHNIVLIHYLEVEQKGKTRGQKIATNYETRSSYGTIGIQQAIQANGIVPPDDEFGVDLDSYLINIGKVQECGSPKSVLDLQDGEGTGPSCWTINHQGNNNEPDLTTNDVFDFDSIYPASPRETGEPMNATYEKSDTIMVESSHGSNDMVCIIKDFSPDWAYQNTGTKVLIWGTFSNSSQQGESCQWYCVFGEDEVRAEYMSESVLRCTTPQMKAAGRVTFSVKPSTGLVSSEVMEFEFRVEQNQDSDDNSYRNEMAQMGLDRLLRLSSIPPKIDSSRSELKSEINELLVKYYIEPAGGKHVFAPKGETSQITDEHMDERYDKKGQRLIDNVREWLFQMVDTGGRGVSVLDKGGQGLLHYAATLGYDWILEPATKAGIDVDFRDSNGWTALHWAAYCGRYTTVGTLVSLGADARAMNKKAQTPAELASTQKHRKLADYLSEKADISQNSHHNWESRQAHCVEPMEIEHSHDTNAMQDAIFQRWRRSVITALSRLKQRRKSLPRNFKLCNCIPTGCEFHI